MTVTTTTMASTRESKKAPADTVTPAAAAAAAKRSETAARTASSTSAAEASSASVAALLEELQLRDELPSRSSSPAPSHQRSSSSSASSFTSVFEDDDDVGICRQFNLDICKVTTDTPYKNNPNLVLPVQIDTIDVNAELSASDKRKFVERRDDQIRGIVATLCPILLPSEVTNNAGSTPEFLRRCLQVKPLTGGLSNELFVVEPTISNNENDLSPSPVLVRLHPAVKNDGSMEIINRRAENFLVAWLADVGIAPVMWGRFVHGRVEEFYPHHETLSYAEMGAYAAPIAQTLADLHRRSLSDLPSEFLQSSASFVTGGGAGDIWHRVDSWIDAATQIQTKQTSQFRDLLHQVQTEWLFIKSQLMVQGNETVSADKATRTLLQQSVEQFCRQVCLTHMDCQSLNLLRPVGSSQTSLKLIDYEYSGLNPRAADIANTFCEHADMNHLAADYETQYPSIDQQNVFLTSYLDTLCSAEQKSSDCPADNSLLNLWKSSNKTGGVHREDILSALRQEIGKYTCVSHTGWAAWSLLQMTLSNIDFDYQAYAQHRLEGHYLFKQKYFYPSGSHL